MFIESLALINYNPFLLRGITKVRLDFTSIYQLIIGTNGTGKSSILRQLSPLPAVVSDFAQTGSKEIVIRHLTNHYRLVSFYKDKVGRHEFWMNNVNLNDSGTITSQRELVNQHFRLTQSLFTLLMGETKFTQMSSTERRNWLLSISGMNLDFAMEVYEKLKIHTRNTHNLFKHYTKRYNAEVDSLPTENEIIQLEAAVNNLNTIFLDLNKSKKDMSETKTTLIEKGEELYRVINPIVNRVLSKPIAIGGLDITKRVSNDEMASELLRQTHENIRLDQQRLTTLQAEQYELAMVIDEINRGAELGCGDIQQRILELETEREMLLSTLRLLTFDKSDFESIALATDIITPDLTDILTTTPPNLNGRFLSESVELTRVSRDNFLLQKTRIENELDKLSHQIRHLKEGDKTECPNCHHTWIIGSTNVPVETLLQQIEDLEKALIINKMDLESMESFFELHDTYIRNKARLNKHYSALPPVRPLLHEIAAHWKSMENIHNGLPILSQWCKEVETGRRLMVVETELTEAWRVRDVIVGDYEGKVSDVVSKHAIYTEQIEALLANIDANNEMIKQVKDIRQTFNTLNKRREVIMEAMTSMTDISNKIKDAVINETLDLFINHIRDELSDVVTRLNKAKNAKLLVGKLQTELSIADRENKVAKLLVKLISPTDGLIAEKLSIFMDNFIEQINYIISQIWAHDFQLVKYTLENGELDYVFPIRVGKGTFDVPDISYGSSSQVDIVNFSFRLVVMLYLGLEDYPIYLDELAPSLDETHRANIIAFIKEFVDAKQCSQMFMISHYVANHGVFTQAEVCVTDKANILTLPSVYNKHCQFL